MIKRVLVVLVVMLIGFGLPAVAGMLTLHPSGFGQHSYSAWKAHEGLPDSDTNPMPEQALYFQKMTATATVAAGVAVFKGFAGLPVNQITGLEFKYRDDGHCGAGAPRWNIISQDPVTGKRYIIFVGCAGMATSGEETYTNTKGESHTWIKKTLPAPLGPCAPFDPDAPAVSSCANFPVTQLALVFDEGTDAGPGFVFLDDITVATANGVKMWQSASDNGNKSTAWLPALGPAVAYAQDLLSGSQATVAPAPQTDVVPAAPEDLVPEGELVPASHILADLLALFPGLALTDLFLYPDVLP
jgi:hypothetical protein